MGGRLTEMFDYMNCPPEELQERKKLYCSFSIGEEEKAVRRKIRSERRKKETTTAPTKQGEQDEQRQLN